MAHEGRGRLGAMRRAARVIVPAGVAAGALAVLATVHERLVDIGADVALIGSLLDLARAVFQLIADSYE
jgi:hypothetical protein